MSSGRPPVLGAVLAGGASRRFGRDKTVEVVDGVAMGRRAVEALRPHCAEVVVVSSRSETPGGWARTVPDLRPGEGPLAGIEAALREAERLELDGAFVLAADLPRVGGEVVERLLGVWREEHAGRTGVAAARAGDPPFEPLCAVYPVHWAARVTELLDRGERAARVLMEEAGGAVAQLAPELAADVARNVNRPSDLEAES